MIIISYSYAKTSAFIKLFTLMNIIIAYYDVEVKNL